MDDKEGPGFLLPHPLYDKQVEVLSAVMGGKYRIVSFIAGRSSGKSLIGAIALACLVIANWDLPDAAYICAAPNYKTLQGGMMMSFKMVFDDLKIVEFNKNEMMATVNNKAPGRRAHRIYFRSLDNENALEGINNVQGIWADEAGQYYHMGWRNLRARASLRRAPIWLTTTPYGLGFLYSDVFLPWERNDTVRYREGDELRTYSARDYIHVVRAWSFENPGHEEDAALQRQILGKEEFERSFSGNFQQLTGLVYADFRPETHCFDIDRWQEIFGLSYPNIPDHFRVTAGVDWGSSDGNPFAVIIVAHGPNGVSYQVDEVLRNNLSGDDMKAILEEKCREWGIQQLWCDQDPKMILDLNARGVPAQRTDKRAGQNYGIAQHRGLIRTKRRLVFRECTYTIDSYQSYGYRKHTNPEKAPHVKPSHIMSDLMDAARYETVGENPNERQGNIQVRPAYVPGGNEVAFTNSEEWRSTASRIDRVKKPSALSRLAGFLAG